MENTKNNSSDKKTIFLNIAPPAGTAQQRKFSFRTRRTYLPEKVREARAQFESALLPFRPEHPLNGPLEVEQKWFYPFPKSRCRKGLTIQPKTTVPDSDNVAKMLNDACTHAGIWKDDRLIYKLMVEKYFVDPAVHPVGVEIKITPYSERSI